MEKIYILTRTKDLLSRCISSLKSTINLRVIFAFGLLLFTLNSFSQTVTTDKVDYMPGDSVLASGEGWGAYENVELLLTEQEFNNLGEGITQTVQCDANGDFSENIYHVVNADLGAFFHLRATGLTSLHVATITFNDAGGDYGIDYSAYDPDLYEHVYVDQVVAPVGRGISPLGLTSHSKTKESLRPEGLALGQIVAFEYFVRVDAGAACNDDVIRIEGEYETYTTNSGEFGFIPADINLVAAFVDNNQNDANFIDDPEI